jgi:hypothetical protein
LLDGGSKKNSAAGLTILLPDGPADEWLLIFRRFLKAWQAAKKEKCDDT